MTREKAKILCNSLLICAAGDNEMVACLRGKPGRKQLQSFNRFERQLLPLVNEKQRLQTAFAALEPFKLSFFLVFINNTRCTHSFQLPCSHWIPKPPLLIERPQHYINSSFIFKHVSLLFFLM